MAALLTTLLAAAALLATLTSWRLVLLTGFLLTTLLATLLATLLLAALLFATHHDSPSRNDFRPKTMFSERICSPLEFLHTKEHFRAGPNNVPLEYAFAVPHKKKLKFQMTKNCSEAGAKLAIESWTDMSPKLEIAFNEVVSFSLAWHCACDRRSQTMSAYDVMTNVSSSSLTVTDWYKQPIYDKSDSKIGDQDWRY